MTLLIPVSWGELFDKIAILEIKSARIEDPSKLSNIRNELGLLLEVVEREGGGSTGDPDLKGFRDELSRVNESLWDTEDAIRECESSGDFGPRFLELARSVYRTNDRRAALKQQINLLLGSALVEEKSYRDY